MKERIAERLRTSDLRPQTSDLRPQTYDPGDFFSSADPV
jgi:hypothetical protein